MHERSLCDGLLTRVLEIAGREGATAVRSVRIRVGALSGIDPAQLAAAFPAAAAGTPAQDAHLSVETAPPTIRCLACGARSAVTPARLDCRHCGSDQTQLLYGTGLWITDIELVVREDRGETRKGMDAP